MGNGKMEKFVIWNHSPKDHRVESLEASKVGFQHTRSMLDGLVFLYFAIIWNDRDIFDLYYIDIFITQPYHKRHMITNLAFRFISHSVHEETGRSGHPTQMFLLGKSILYHIL